MGTRSDLDTAIKYRILMYGQDHRVGGYTPGDP